VICGILGVYHAEVMRPSMTTSGHGTRTPTCYDPFADVTEQGWRVELARLEDDATERYDWGAQIAYFDPDAYADDDKHALAHAAYHIRNNDRGDRMTPLQEANANSAAYLWLDREYL
jgi:hypothetical protein